MSDLIAAVLADPSARWAIVTAPGVLLGPWSRTATTSRRETFPYEPGDWESYPIGFCVEITVGRKSGYSCASGCARPGRGPYCPKCGTPVEHVPSQTWTITDAPDHFASDAGPFRTRDEAEAWVDARATEKKWSLVPDAKEPK